MEKQPSRLRRYWRVWILLLILIIAVVMVAIAFSSAQRTENINSFQGCADAGYPIQMSYPEVCTVPGVGSFTNN